MLAIRQYLEVPILFIGTGEGMGDLAPFDAEDFVEALLAPGGRGARLLSGISLWQDLKPFPTLANSSKPAHPPNRADMVGETKKSHRRQPWRSAAYPYSPTVMGDSEKREALLLSSFDKLRMKGANPRMKGANLCGKHCHRLPSCPNLRKMAGKAQVSCCRQPGWRQANP